MIDETLKSDIQFPRINFQFKTSSKRVKISFTNQEVRK